MIEVFRRWWPGRTAEHLQTGARGERVAARHLKRAGYKLLGRNLRLPGGEIDLAAWSPDRSTLVIIEVKTNQNDSAYRPEVRVNPAKQRKLVSLAHELTKRQGLQHHPVRFDVIAVEFGEGPPTVRHHPGAFEARL